MELRLKHSLGAFLCWFQRLKRSEYVQVQAGQSLLLSSQPSARGLDVSLVGLLLNVALPAVSWVHQCWCQSQSLLTLAPKDSPAHIIIQLGTFSWFLLFGILTNFFSFSFQNAKPRQESLFISDNQLLACHFWNTFRYMSCQHIYLLSQFGFDRHWFWWLIQHFKVCL